MENRCVQHRALAVHNEFMGLDEAFDDADIDALKACLTGVKRTSFGTDKNPVFGVKIF